MKRSRVRRLARPFGACLAAALVAPAVLAVELPQVTVSFQDADGAGLARALQIVLLLTALSLAPAFMVMVTSFTRIVVVLSFLRRALATQTLPPNQLLIGLALFLTVFIMAPVWQRVYADAYLPLQRGEITQEEAFRAGMQPVREFMLAQTREKDLALFVDMAGIKEPEGPDQIPTYVVIPAFVTSELRTAFQMGFLLFLPFLVIDMVVASVLMSMGMMMLPPVMISLPLKVVLFVLVDGWALVVRSLAESFVR